MCQTGPLKDMNVANQGLLTFGFNYTGFLEHMDRTLQG